MQLTIPFYNISGVGAFSHMTVNVVHVVLSVVFHISVGTFRIVAYRVVIAFISGSNDTISGRSLSINSAPWQIYCKTFPRQPLLVLTLV